MRFDYLFKLHVEKMAENVCPFLEQAYKCDRNPHHAFLVTTLYQCKIYNIIFLGITIFGEV